MTARAGKPQEPPTVVRSAQNARRHGLAVRTEVDEEVLDLYRVIADDWEELASTGQTAAGYRLHSTTLELARAEVQVRRATEALKEVEEKIEALLEADAFAGTPEARGRREVLRGFGLTPDLDERHRELLDLMCISISGNLSLRDPVSIAMKEFRLLLRYRREAESWRKKAFAAWCRDLEKSSDRPASQFYETDANTT
ncbi:hypothetical protein [Tranquillimonas alkanivorans]|uniref:hypothetical protein n=1 Tax=Tranquillimonas alkanivorans TaxID=441119 RepID=UPI0011607B2E|nr:hypothetical protein [Tranquillimonas alkanivorans]